MNWPICLFLLLFASCSLVQNSSISETYSGIQILGVAQDGGRPQLGCKKPCCLNAKEAEPIAALRVQSGTHWVLVDASPDMAIQISSVGSMPSAIVLTHAHIGHYTGLMQLGHEVMGALHIPVWCSARMATFLRENGPWSQLVALGNIELHEFQDDVVFSPIPGVTFHPRAVPHRDEYSDTFGFSIEVDGVKTLYIPDIDSWETWGQLTSLARRHDVAILDATFYNDSELPGRDMSSIPHPRVPQTMELLQPLVHRGVLRVMFTHLNHTNPLWMPSSAASKNVRSRGFEVARRGLWVTRGSLRVQMRRPPTAP